VLLGAAGHGTARLGPCARPALTGGTTGELSVGCPGHLDARRRFSLPDRALGQSANVRSGRPISEHARGAILPDVLGSSRNRQRRGVEAHVSSVRLYRQIAAIIADAASTAVARQPKRGSANISHRSGWGPVGGITAKDRYSEWCRRLR
jgi:hypothetical protein